MNSAAFKALFAIIFFTINSVAADAADITVTVKGLTPLVGSVHVAIYDEAEKFPDSDGMIVDQIKPITSSEMSFVFEGLDPGEYALATFHDENLNGDFDTGLFSFPLEGFAFSNGAKPGLSAPTFAEAAIDLPVEGTATQIEMDYWIGQ